MAFYHNVVRRSWRHGPETRNVRETDFSNLKLQTSEVKMLRKSLYIVGGLFITAVFAAAAVLGAWAYNLNTQLAQSHTEYQALKSNYDKLSSEYSKAQADFKAQASQADVDLNESKTQVTKLESEVKKLQTENDGLRTQMTEIQANVAMLSDFWFMSDSTFEHKINASDDEQLKKLYANLQKSKKWEDYVDLMSYMIKSIDSASDISWLPSPSVSAVGESGDFR